MRRALALALLAVPAAAPAGAPAASLGPGGAPVLSADPATGRTLAVWAVAQPDDDRDGLAETALAARPLDRDGEPAGPQTDVGRDAIPDLGVPGGRPLAVALDTRRHRHLVVWSGRQAGMAAERCPPQGPPGLEAPCARRDTEVFARLLDRSGTPIGPARMITVTGPPASATTRAAAPAVAYSRRDDAFLVAYTAYLDERRTELRVQPLSPEGTEPAPERRLRGVPASDSPPVAARVIAAPGRGFLLAAAARELYALRVSASGRPATAARRVSPPGGPTATPVALAGGHGGALVLWSEARPGSEAGPRAVRLDARGRQRGGAVAQRAQVRDAVATRTGWAYAAVREAGFAAHEASVAAARRDGRARGAAVVLSGPQEDALEPTLARQGRRLLAGWSARRGEGGSYEAIVRSLRAP